MQLSEFDYNLPKKYIAQTPAEPRDHSKLMIVHRKTGKIEHKHFYDIGDYLNENNVLVVNDTKVMSARIFGNKSTGARVEILLLHKKFGNAWETLAKPVNRLKVGDEIIIAGNINAKIIEILGEGRIIIKFAKDIIRELDKIGVTPLPPYIKSVDANLFKKRYQTVYSKVIGSSAAPTAGLHFTPELLKKLRKKGIDIKNATLHIGLDTFRPMNVENIEDHKMHSEYCELDKRTSIALNEAKKKGQQIIAIGTTTTRVLESVFNSSKGEFRKFKGLTNIFIYPGYKFRAVDMMITNFHLPKSSLLLMVSAFAGKELVARAYEEAKKHNYRFFSFGDAMLIL